MDPNSSAFEDDQVRLGSEIRQTRLRRKMKLSELADKAGVSASLVSQIENGKASPSLSTLRRFANALGVKVANFFIDEAESDGVRHGHGRIVRADQRKHLYLPASKIRCELVTPDLDGDIEFVLTEVEPGGVEAELMSHPGEEVILVMEGTLRVCLLDEVYLLKRGDGITFDSSVPHSIHNPGRQNARLVSAITPPSW